MEKTRPMVAKTEPSEQARPAERDLLRRPRGPIRAHHDHTRQMGRRHQPLRSALWRADDESAEARSEILGSRPDLLRGVRIFKYPYIALTSESLAKPWRHILSQKVIAGTMTVHPPYVRKPST